MNVKRSSYNIKSAMRFKNVFDKALSNHKQYGLKSPDLIIRYDEAKLSPGTLHQRLNDALRYLIDQYSNIPEELLKDVNGNTWSQASYALLRGIIKFRQSPEGIKIIFPFSAGLNSCQFSENASIVKTVDWKTELTQFLENDKETMFYKNNLDLSSDDIAYVTNLCNQSNIEHKVSLDSITIVKS